MTPAVRAAEAAKVRFALHRYEHDPAAESFGREAAEKLGVPPERVFKTLVVRVDGKSLVLAVLPVAGRLDLKKLAAAGGAKAELADPAAERATGYVLGGVSPLGVRKKLPTFRGAVAKGLHAEVLQLVVHEAKHLKREVPRVMAASTSQQPIRRWL